MNILTAFTLKTMKTYRKWSTVTILGVALSTTLLTGVVTLTFSGISILKEQFLNSSGKWTVSVSNARRGDASYWESKEPGDQVSVIKEYGFALLPGSGNKGKPYIQVSELDGEAIENFFVKPTEGRLPDNENEIILPESIQWNSGRNVSIGDTFTLDLGKRKLPDGRYLLENSIFQESFFPYLENTNSSSEEITPVDTENIAEDLGPETLEITQTRTYTVVGFMETPIGEDSWSAAYRGFTVPPSLESETFEDEPVTLFIWTESPNWVYQQSMLEQGAERGYTSEDIRFNSDYLDLAGAPSSAYDFANGIYVAILFPIAIILVSSFFLIINSFAISVSERTRHLALFATAGATRSQKRAYVFREGIFVGICGIPLGMLAGLLIVQTLFVIAEPAFLAIGDWNEMKLQMIVTPGAIALIVLLEIFTIFFSVLIPSYKASRIMPIDAIRQVGSNKIAKKSWAFPAFFIKIFGIESVLAIKNLRRNRSRYRATTFSLVIGLILFLSVSSISSYTQSYSDYSSDNSQADITLNIEGVSKAAIQRLYQQIRRITDVKEVTYSRLSYLQLFIEDSKISDEAKKYMDRYSQNSLSLFLYVYDDRYFEEYAENIGADPADFKDALNPACILINRAESQSSSGDAEITGNILDIEAGEILKGIFYSSDLFLTQGDSLNWDKSPLPERNYFHVDRNTKQMPIGISSKYFGVYMIMPESLYLATIAGTGEEKSSQDNSPTFFIQTDNSFDVEFSIREMCETLPSSQITLFNQAAEKERANQVNFVINLIAFSFISLISLISLANLFNTITTTTALRQKEYAMLRSVGMATKSFFRMIRLESFFLGSFALAFGVPISVLISFLIFISQGYNYFFNFYVPWESYLSATLIVFALIFFTMLYSISRINRQNIIDALKSDSE